MYPQCGWDRFSALVMFFDVSRQSSPFRTLSLFDRLTHPPSSFLFFLLKTLNCKKQKKVPSSSLPRKEGSEQQQQQLLLVRLWHPQLPRPKLFGTSYGISTIYLAAAAAQPRPQQQQHHQQQPAPPPPPRRANLLFIARADRALLSRTSLTLLGLQPAVFFVADEPSKHSGRVRATELFNGSMWRAAPLLSSPASPSSSPSVSSEGSDDAPAAAAALSWLGSPSALLEGARVSSSSSSSSSSPAVTLPISIADPRLRGKSGGSLELTLAAGSTGNSNNGNSNNVLEGGVVAAAIDASGRAGFGGKSNGVGGGGAEGGGAGAKKSGGGGSGGGFLSDPRKEINAAEAESLSKKKEKGSSSSSSSQGDGVLELRDVALYIDVAAPLLAAATEEASSSSSSNPSPSLGAKQGVTSFYGCSGSPLGTLSSFGNACGLYGSSYFGGGMLGDTSGFGGGGTIG